MAVLAAVAAVTRFDSWSGSDVIPSGLFPAGPAACAPGMLTGAVTHVRDGDTIEVEGLLIRLSGLAAPERGAPGGRQATAAMRELVAGRTVRCQLDGEATYDRCAAVCYLNGADVAAELVRAGYARDCPRYSGGRYAAAERQAASRGATIGETYRLPGYCRR